MIRSKIFRYFLIAVWISVLVAGWNLYLNGYFARDSNTVANISSSVLAIYSFYLFLGAMRGFTLIPATYLIAFGLFILPPLPLFFLTVVGELISSAAIYYFADSIGIHEYFQRKHSKQVSSLEIKMKKYQLPVIIGWSFFPLLPTDAVCYVSGIMKLGVRKLLLGILIGEGTCSGMYIFFGSYLVNLMGK